MIKGVSSLSISNAVRCLPETLGDIVFIRTVNYHHETNLQLFGPKVGSDAGVVAGTGIVARSAPDGSYRYPIMLTTTNVTLKTINLDVSEPGYRLKCHAY
jgi:hypothetical protein